jgi:hypothetical protein
MPGMVPRQAAELSMTDPRPQSEARIAHAVVFLLLLVGCSLAPALRGWPWIWLAPFAAYFLLVAVVQRLRRSLDWLHFGSMSTASVAATVALMAVTIAVLIVFQTVVKPDLDSLRAALPLSPLGGPILTGAVFAAVNATLEELVFRGILFDAMQAKWNATVAAIATALLFGLAHLHGYPSGATGACLAALFGVAMGALRLRSGGLALPIAAHIAADAVIFAIVVSAGPPG